MWLQVFLAPHHLQRWVVCAEKVFLPQLCQHCLSGHPGDVRLPDYHCSESAVIQEVLWLLDYAGGSSEPLLLPMIAPLQAVHDNSIAIAAASCHH